MSPTQDDWIERDAWAALYRARHNKEWERRDAPSPGAMAKAIAGMLSYPPSYIEAVRERIGLFLSEEQMRENGKHVPARKTFKIG